jgi:hypothetical protein
MVPTGSAQPTASEKEAPRFHANLTVFAIIGGGVFFILSIATGGAVPGGAQGGAIGGFLGAVVASLINLVVFKQKVRASGLVQAAIIIVICGALAAFSIPNYLRGREIAQRSECISNLRLIDDAKETWALEFRAASGTVPRAADVDKCMKTGHTFESLKCPAGGDYDIRQIDHAPTCTIPGHKLAQGANRD